MLFSNNPEDYKFLDSMDIESEKGTKVVYGGYNGYDGDRQHANQYLTIGEVYTIDWTDIGSSYTNVKLEEIAGKTFNSVMFIPAFQ